MKKKYPNAVLSTLLLLICLPLTACGSSDTANNGESVDNNADKPLNITIYLDLSDRITREMQPSQKDRDIAIVNKLVQCFKDKCVSDQILRAKNRIKVLFYPSPNSSEIATLASALELDMSKLKGKEKRLALKDIETKFNNSLTQIYDETLKAHKWVGSDIWGFFSNKKVDDQCIRKDSRNILVILTDGYLYHINNKQKEGEAYSYILPQTLNNPNSSLMVKRQGLDDLEVIMLEVNPFDPKIHDKLSSVLEDWFRGMGVKKFVVSETDLPNNTATVIDNFIAQ